jgi:hypothetical protein
MQSQQFFIQEAVRRKKEKTFKLRKGRSKRINKGTISFVF